jgi:acetolactate synthase-1/2/3 large subunit
LNEKLKEVLASDEATLIEIVMSPNQKYLPRLGTKKNLDGSLTSPPLEDMEPLIPIEQLQDLLGYQPTKSSFEARR